MEIKNDALTAKFFHPNECFQKNYFLHKTWIQNLRKIMFFLPEAILVKHCEGCYERQLLQ